MIQFLKEGIWFFCFLLPVSVAGQPGFTSPVPGEQNTNQAGSYTCGSLDTSLCYTSKPFPKVDFAIAKRWESSGLISLYQAPLLMDMDNDCIPEIVASGIEGFTNNPRITSGVSVIKTASGAIQYTIATPYYSWGGPTAFAVADLNEDAFPEIVIAAADTPQNPPDVRGRLVCYDALGNLLWISNDQYGKFTGTAGSGGAPAFADFNRDGVPEVYVYNEIFNARTGVKLADGGFLGQGISSRSFNNFSYATSVAADLDDNRGDLELAAGYTIYEITITNAEGTAGNLMEARPILLNNQYRDGHTSVADINQDGILDVIVASQGTQSTSRLYAYYLLNGMPVLLAQTAMPSAGGGCCTEACGISFVGDLTGNGRPVIGITRAFMLLTYQYDGTPALKEYWRLSTNDESGTTGMTMFDFNQDGVQEIVYRDEDQLRIINGAINPPVNLATFTCVSGTGSEYPIVGDINFSGESNICVPCASGNSRTTGKIHVFGAPFGQQPWAPSRRIWNQYAYNVYNINDDLTVPDNPSVNTSNTNKKFNNFLVQASLLDTSGNFVQTSTDLTGEITCLYYDDLSDQYTVRFEISNRNTASAAMTDSVRIFIFNGNPFINGQVVGSFAINQPIPPGRKIFPLEYTFTSSSFDTLFIILNTSGKILNGPPLSGFEFFDGECDYRNNILTGTAVQHITSTRLQICEGDSVFHEGNWYHTSGIYNFTKPSASGCDTLSRMILKVNRKYEDHIITEVCSGDSVFLNQSWIRQDTTFSNTYLTASGCDSIVTYTVLFYEPDTLFENISACLGDSVFINDVWYQKNSLVKDTIISLPCPVFKFVEVGFNPVYMFEERFSLCPGDTIKRHGLSFAEAGQYTLAFKTFHGCDSSFLLFIEEVVKPDLPVFEPDCQAGSYQVEIHPTAGWTQRWEDGSTSLRRTLRDSFSGFVEFYFETLQCRYKNEFFLEKIPETAPLVNFADTVVFPGKIMHINLDLDSTLWKVQWFPGYSVSCDTCFNSTLSPTQNMDVFIRMYHISGCSYENVFRITVDERIDVIIPNIFSPDLTGPNKEWTWLIPDCFKINRLEVYDRWGNLVCSLSNTTRVKWDGTFNGRILEAGVYTFLTNYERPDGSIVKKSGDVTILRL